MKTVADHMRWLAWAIVALTAIGCHAFFIAPILFAHGSSSAFDLAMGLYFVLVLWFLAVLLCWYASAPRGRK